MICGVQFWFTIHRPVMMTTFLLSIISLIFALAHKKWKWVDSSSGVNFAHSILGILTIAFASFQVRY